MSKKPFGDKTIEVKNAGKYTAGLMYKGKYVTKFELLAEIEAHEIILEKIKGKKLSTEEKEDLVLNFCKMINNECDATRDQLFHLRKTQSLTSAPFVKNAAKRQLAGRCQELADICEPKPLDEAVKLVAGEMNARMQDTKKMLGAFELMEKGFLNIGLIKSIETHVIEEEVVGTLSKSDAKQLNRPRSIRDALPERVDRKLIK